MYTFYPSFHKDRPRFLNTVTLYVNTIASLDEGLLSYLKEHFEITASEVLEVSKLAYKNYVEWEANGGQELRLSAFKLTNRQMFWFSAVNCITAKYQKIVRDAHLLSRLQNKFMHVVIKDIKEFRDDYQCEEMTTGEKQEYEEYEKELAKIGF